MDPISDKKSIRKPKVAFVLGGPGSGKGTLCQRLAEKYNVKHLSVGALLRILGSSGSEDGREIQNIINEGKIVPPIDTIHVLWNAMRNHNNNIFLIDGFPRNEENRVAFENITGIVPEFVFFLDCPEQEMERRLLARNQNRPDDNMQAVRKRFKVFMESTMPVVEYYEAIGKLHKINAAKSVEEVENRSLPYMMPLIRYDLLEVSAELLHAIDHGDFTTYQRLCDAELTAFEPEAQGHLVEGLDFHQFYFKQNKQSELGESSQNQSTISSPKVKVINDIWIVTYTRLQQKQGLPSIGMVDAYNETRIWRRQKGSEGAWEWKNVHFHRSKAPVNRAFQFSIHEEKHRQPTGEPLRSNHYY